MTQSKAQLDAERYSEKVVAEIAALTDEEIMAAASEEFRDPKAEAARVRALLLNAAKARGKKRLRAAQAEVAAQDVKSGGVGETILSFANKKAKLARIIAKNPQLTLAARQGNGLDEAEVDGYLADLAELGITDD